MDRAIDRTTSTDDIFLLPGGEDLGQAHEDQALHTTEAAQSAREGSSLPWGQRGVDTSSSGLYSTIGQVPVSVDEGSRAASPLLLKESERQNPVRALYETVADIFGEDGAIAETLEVPRAHVKEWKRGTAPDEGTLDRLENLAATVSKLRGLYELEVILDWLQGLNTHLGGARPIDVLIRGRLSRVIAAIEAERGGAHA